LFLFIIQVITGILLLLYYKGSEQLAFESIQFIMSKVQFGWLIRSIHSWAANLFILSAFIHMFSVYFEKSYREPREITWLTGMLMLFLAMGFGFSGYLLPWNELAFFATKVGTDIAGVLPVVGKPLMVFLRGGTLPVQRFRGSLVSMWQFSLASSLFCWGFIFSSYNDRE
jgi:cytochrome b6